MSMYVGFIGEPFESTGVYKCGFAQSQSAYDEAVVALFNALDRLENVLSKSRCCLLYTSPSPRD